MQNALDGAAGQAQSGGGVGVCNDDGLVQAVVIGGVKGEVLFQRNDVGGDVQQAAPHAVAAVSDIRKSQRVALVTESPQRKEQILVAAVAGHDLGRLQAEMRRRRAQQLGTGGVGVKAQLFHLGFAHGCHHPGRRQIGAFVGIQFDVLLILRLFSRRIRGDSGQGRGKKTAHNGFLFRFCIPCALISHLR